MLPKQLLVGHRKQCGRCYFRYHTEIGNSSKPFKYHYPNGTIFEKDCRGKLLNEILNFNGNIATAWAKLIKRDFLLTHEILHNEILRQGSEGVEFNLRLFNKVERVYFTDAKYYTSIIPFRFPPNTMNKTTISF